MSSAALQILDVLVESGVDTIFGIPGGAISRLYAELVHRPQLRIVNATHESNAVFLAMGHALATGKPGVVFTTAGPGVTNALTGLASANADGVPVLVIAGEVPRASFGRGALQEGSAHGFDALAMARPISKFAAQLARPSSAAGTVRKAIATMTTGKTGAAFISLPLDVANAEVSPQPVVGSPHLEFQIDEEGCAHAAYALAHAERPLLLIGSGARGAKNRNAVFELAHRTQTPVATTPKAKGIFPEGDPLYLGVLGFGGHDSVMEYLNQKPDVVIVIGSSLNDFSTNAWTPLLQGRGAFIQIDIDSGQIGKNYPVDIGLLGPMDQVIAEMLTNISEVRPRIQHPALSIQTTPESPKGLLTTPAVVNVMSEVCSRHAVFTSDMGEHLGVALHCLRTRTAGSFLTCLGFGSMGSGVVSSIGHALGDPSRRVFAICGDGGFLMSGNELQTAVRFGAPVTFVIINDGRYNMCHHGFRDQFGKAPSCDLGAVNFAQMASAFGATGIVVHDTVELINGLRIQEGPVVLDIRVDADVRLKGSQRVAALRQFTDKDTVKKEEVHT